MRFDVATALAQGQREMQEDALIADFAVGVPFGFAVVADGMGGHAAGDVASDIVVTEVSHKLKDCAAGGLRLEEGFETTLLNIVNTANASIRTHVRANPGHRGMGATVVAPVVFEDRLYWISVGDSPLYLLRRGKLTKLNDEHSMARHIDMMVSSGQLDPEAGRTHPDRSCLTSALMGEEIPAIDCPVSPTRLAPGDIVLAASDGVLSLLPEEIEAVVALHRRRSANEIAQALMHAIEMRADPHQDNISLVLIKAAPGAAPACTGLG